jgi:hypothetical protein
VIRHHPGALPGEPVIEYDGEAVPPPSPPPRSRPAAAPARRVDYSYDQRPEAQRSAFSPGDPVEHPTLGAGLVRSCDGPGPEGKVTVAFPGVGEKRVIARFLRKG